MLFNSVDFLVFFPIVALVYFLIPQRVKYLWLLAASYYFYMSWNPRYALLMLVSTLTTWGCGLLLAACGKKAGKWGLGGCIAVNLGILFLFKYYVFAAASVEKAFGLFHISLRMPAFDVLLPVGISFYTFQALGYVLDVWRGGDSGGEEFPALCPVCVVFPPAGGRADRAQQEPYEPDI